MSTPIAPITGLTNVTVGSTTTYSNVTPGGEWKRPAQFVNNLTIDKFTGVATMLMAASNVPIVYTVGADSVTLYININAAGNLTNGLNYNTVYNALKNRVLWQEQGVISGSNRYFEDFHTLCDTNIIRQLQPNASITDAEFTSYLGDKQRAVIMSAVNAIYNQAQIVDAAKLAFYRQDLPIAVQYVQNNGQFVGMKIFVGMGDYAVKLNSVQLFFNADVTFDLYLYNDQLLSSVKVKTVTAEAYSQTIIDLENDYIFNNLTSSYKGGRWYLGYYQDDIAAQNAQAIYYNINIQDFHPLAVMAFSAPVVTDIHRNFTRNNIGQNNLMYGMNLEISTYVDATNNIVQNAHLFDELLGLQMAAKIIENIIYAYRSNATERIISNKYALGTLYGELNQASPTTDIPYTVGLKEKINREVNRVKQAFQAKKTFTRR